MFRVAILGRPNVGKSTLFNRLCGYRKAIVGNEPGITRDRIQGFVQWEGKRTEVVDTGGMMPNVADIIPLKILEQVEVAISESDLLLLVVDGRAGVTPPDEQLLPLLRRSGRPVWVVANKIDTLEQESEAAAFYSLGFEAVFPVSAEHSRGITDLLDAIAARVQESMPSTSVEERKEISVAVVGRPNVGKSSLVNRLLGMERVIVSEIPGTTRDAVDTLLTRDGVQYRIIDTAGIRRKGRTEGRTEKISVLVARRSLERTDVALLLIDSVEGVTKLDAAIGGYAAEAGCSVLIVLNKWDLVQKTQQSLQEFVERVHRRMKYLNYAPIVAVSSRTGQRVSNLFDMIREAREARRLRIPTGTLNNLFVPELSQNLRLHNPASRFDIRYITQARTDPPLFVVFTAGRNPLHFSTERYLVNQLRERFGFYATPIRIQQRLKPPRKRAPK